MFYIDAPVSQAISALDLYSPSWKGRERHSVRTDLADELLIQAAREVTWREVPVLRRLLFDHFGGERLDPDQPIIEGFLTGGSYSLLHDGGSEIVIGLLRLLDPDRIPSGLIRHRWLAAVVRRATAEHLRSSAITEHREYETGDDHGL